MDVNPGLLPFEINLLELVQKITNGSQVNIGKTGTKVIFKPGIIDCNNGVPIEHACHLDRSVAYYLEVICVLAMFGKTQLGALLTGNTDDSVD